MPAGLDQGDMLAGANGDPDAMYRVLVQTSQTIILLQSQTGVDAAPVNQQSPGGTGTNSVSVPVPPSPTFQASAAGGIFTVQIFPPNVAQNQNAGAMPGANLIPGDPLGPNVASISRTPNPNTQTANSNLLPRMLYKLEAATDSAFTQNKAKWGPSAVDWYAIPVTFDPPDVPVSLYFRVRAQFQNSQPTSWVATTDPVTASPAFPVVVASGVAIGLTATPSGPVAGVTADNAVGGVYEVSGLINILTYGAGSVSLVLTYTDENGNAQTQDLLLVNGSTVSQAPAASGDWSASPLTIGADAGFAISVTPICAGFTGSFDCAATITRVV